LLFFSLDNLSHQRVNIIKEIVETERTYTQSLKWAVEHFLSPLKSARLLSADQISTIFSEVNRERQIER